MAEASMIKRAQTAVLIMDDQHDIVSNVEASSPGLLDRAASVLSAARRAGVPVIYVVVRFRPGHPEVSARNKIFSGMQAASRLAEGSPEAEIHDRVRPQANEVIVTKRRVGAFSTTDMETVLRAHNVTHLVLLGIATSGVVLSTVRWAADADYELTVVEDGCVVSAQDVIQALGA